MLVTHTRYEPRGPGAAGQVDGGRGEWCNGYPCECVLWKGVLVTMVPVFTYYYRTAGRRRVGTGSGYPGP